MQRQLKNCNNANNSNVSATLTHETGNPNKSYSDKLKSPKWQKKRLEILNLRGFKCELCGDEENQIQVHHRFYLKGREPWQYDNDVFQVLCENCHDKNHKKEEIKEVFPEKYRKIISLIESLESENITYQKEFIVGNIETILEEIVIINEPNLVAALSDIFSDSEVNVLINMVIGRFVYMSENERLHIINEELCSQLNDLKSKFK